MINWELYFRDPTTIEPLNNGVSKDLKLRNSLFPRGISEQANTLALRELEWLQGKDLSLRPSGGRISHIFVVC